MKKKDIYNAEKNFDVISNYQELLIWGFDFEELEKVYDSPAYSTPVTPLVPLYRYEDGRVYRYIGDEDFFGEIVRDEGVGLGLEVVYRGWVPAELF
jgi:hypothetical protein